MNEISPWRNTPRLTIAIFLFGVFFVFTATGFAGDSMGMGSQPPLKFAIVVLLAGLFAIAYAITGFSLRKRWWKGCIVVFLVQGVVMSLVNHWLHDTQVPSQLAGSELARLHSRLNFDAVATIIAVSLGYTCFAYVAFREARRYGLTRAEMAVLESEMAAARQVQQVILPAPGESFPGYAVDSVYKPAREVGGDFFQILSAGNGGLLLVFGDVAGKGLPAAMLVSMLVGAIRTAAEDTHDPVLLLRRIHDRLVGRTSGCFSTAISAHIAADGTVTVANAGHLSPYLDGVEIQLPGALPLGIPGGGQYEPIGFELQPGSRLTFFSDGVVEAQNPAGELFGFGRSQAISTEPAASIADAAVRFGQSDDITVVTIERLATGVSSQAHDSASSIAPA
jgi:hypothetical protein